MNVNFVPHFSKPDNSIKSPESPTKKRIKPQPCIRTSKLWGKIYTTMLKKTKRGIADKRQPGNFGTIKNRLLPWPVVTVARERRLRRARSVKNNKTQYIYHHPYNRP